MSTRRQMDTPAAVIAAVAGIILIAASAPFAYAKLQEAEAADKTFGVLYAESSAAEDTVTVAGTGSKQTVDITTDAPIGSVRISSEACEDSFRTGQQAAVMTFSLIRKSESNETKFGPFTYTCASQGDAAKEFTMPGRPDVGSVEAASEKAALAKANALLVNETVTFVLELEANRANGAVPLPSIPTVSPTIAATLKMELRQLAVSVTAPPAEVTK